MLYRLRQLHNQFFSYRKFYHKQVVATHNSNVVVNGDSELVNVMGMNNGQIKVKAKGGMGESAIRTEICSIMEGGQEALHHRYQRLSGCC